ncbi:MoaB/Mog domain-containing protein [Rhodofomes roseus]|uniref:MoaB/Mog domain-containing protein n=1 Tax=Rhodofomes roseus TaxID=34475 RepID=A0ABQ8L147_9APHY|nr:MoaB/Mog domain-containing protein [Rhodofomes roseus]KAH9844355.1 MoaB/Mog domain-containing protein [Rhodofomes roseus]
MSQARVAVLTVSDTAAADTSLDKSGPTIRETLAGAGYEVKYLLVVPDDEPRIRHTVQTWVDQGDVDWIVTTGGTGFGVRDRTPEAIRPLIEREAPGLVHLMIAASLQKTPLAALARPVAGTVKDTLVVTLPGSVKAVKENLEALLGGGVIDHALQLVKGASSRKLHSDVPGASAVAGSGHAHHHHHHHHGHDHHAPQPRTTLSHDPSQPVTTRHRESPYPLVTVDEALASILKEVKPLDTAELPVTANIKGHVLAEDVYAPQDVPSTSTTSVDGYALRSTDPPGIYKVVTSKTHNLADPLPARTIFRINTGGPLPAGANTIVMVEDTRLHGTHKDASGADVEEAEVETLVQVPPGENVRAPGSDTRKGDLVLERGQVLHAAGGEIGTLAFVGRRSVQVYGRPVVAVLSTGNELLDLQDPKPMQGEWGGIWDTNRPSLQAALEGVGYQVIDLGIVPDDLDAHISALRNGVEQADLVLTTGGTSMGASDLLKPVIERHLGGTVHFGRVKVKPGKPTTFATIPTPRARVPMFALPGNPASALVMFHVFVLPALRRLGGWPEGRCQLPRMKVQLRDAMRLDPRPEYHRVVIKAGPEGLVAYSTGGQRSSRVASLSGANGLVALPAQASDGPSELKAGEVAEAVVIGELQMQ